MRPAPPKPNTLSAAVLALSSPLAGGAEGGSSGIDSLGVDGTEEEGCGVVEELDGAALLEGDAEELLGAAEELLDLEPELDEDDDAPPLKVAVMVMVSPALAVAGTVYAPIDALVPRLAPETLHPTKV